MIGRMTFWYSYALNLPRNRSADFQISLAKLSSFGLFSERAILSIPVAAPRRLCGLVAVLAIT